MPSAANLDLHEAEASGVEIYASYSVSKYVADMRDAGSYFRANMSGLWQNMVDVDWDKFTQARIKADLVGITTRQIIEHLIAEELEGGE